MAFNEEDRHIIKSLRQKRPPNSPDLNPVYYKIWGSMQEMVYKTKIWDIEDL